LQGQGISDMENNICRSAVTSLLPLRSRFFELLSVLSPSRYGAYPSCSCVSRRIVHLAFAPRCLRLVPPSVRDVQTGVSLASIQREKQISNKLACHSSDHTFPCFPSKYVQSDSPTPIRPFSAPVTIRAAFSTTVCALCLVPGC
jgi:hypothetical protein